jgi:hypothetical protein
VPLGWEPEHRRGGALTVTTASLLVAPPRSLAVVARGLAPCCAVGYGAKWASFGRVTDIAVVGESIHLLRWLGMLEDT